MVLGGRDLGVGVIAPPTGGGKLIIGNRNDEDGRPAGTTRSRSAVAANKDTQATSRTLLSSFAKLEYVVSRASSKNGNVVVVDGGSENKGGVVVVPCRGGRCLRRCIQKKGGDLLFFIC